MPLIRGLRRLTGHYGDAFICLIGLHVFLHGLGFYILGIAVFRHRSWSFLFALMAMPRIKVGFETFWGLYMDPLPRLSFAALAGFLLAAAIRWRAQPRKWLWIMLGASCLMFVHPVSAPVLGLAVWVGFWAVRPVTWSGRRRIAYMCIIAVLCLFVATPVLITYTRDLDHVAADRSGRVMEAMHPRVDDDLFNVSWSICRALWKMAKSMVLPMGAIGALIVYRLTGSRGKMRMIAYWLVGVLLAAAIVPMAGQAIDGHTRSVPAAAVLARGIRFVVVIMLLSYVWGAMELSRRFRRTRWVRGAMIALSFAWLVYHAVVPAKGIGRQLFEQRVLRNGPQGGAHHEALMAVRERTAPGSRILPVGVDALAVRYGALRPVVYTWKDGVCFAITNHEKLVRWHERSKIFQSLTEAPWSQEKIRKLVEWCRELKVDYLAINCVEMNGLSFGRDVQVVWANGSYSLVHVVPTASLDGSLGQMASEGRQCGRPVR